MRQLSQKGIQALIHLEGNELKAYYDSAHFLTIGVGHLLTAQELSSHAIKIGGASIPWANGITENQAAQLLRQDLAPREQVLDAQCPPLTENQFDAMIIFAFNIGTAAFLGSTLLKKLRVGDLEAVPAQLLRWTKSGGVIVKGLVNRRNAEIAIWDGHA